MEQPPSEVQTVAILQLVSGLLNVFFMSWACYLGFTLVGGLVTGIITLGMFPIGACCGYLACALIPFGMLEIILGIVGLANPKGGAGLQRLLGMAQIGSILFGGFLSCVIGIVVVVLTGRPHVVEYRTAPPALVP